MVGLNYVTARILLITNIQIPVRTSHLHVDLVNLHHLSFNFLISSFSSSDSISIKRRTMTSVLTGSLAFAGFVLAAETYRSYKEKEEAKEAETKVRDSFS